MSCKQTTTNQIKTQRLVKKPDWKELLKAKSRWGCDMFFQILQILEELACTSKQLEWRLLRVGFLILPYVSDLNDPSNVWKYLEIQSKGSKSGG